MQANKITDIVKIIVLVFPIVFLVGLNSNSIIKQNVGQQVWQIKITGYDPRDLLYGHYLVFRYDWNLGQVSHPKAGHGKQDQCLCLNASGQDYKDPVVTPMGCSDQTQNNCISVVKTYKHGSSYSLNRDSVSERYFIPEKNAHKLESLLRNGDKTFRIELMSHKDNSVTVRNLYVDNAPLEDYMRNLKE